MSREEHRSADIMQLLDDNEPEIQREGLHRIVGWLEELDKFQGELDERLEALNEGMDDVRSAMLGALSGESETVVIREERFEMVASQATVKQIMDILREEWPGSQESLCRLIARLREEVKGSRSVEQTMINLWLYAGQPRSVDYPK